VPVRLYRQTTSHWRSSAKQTPTTALGRPTFRPAEAHERAAEAHDRAAAFDPDQAARHLDAAAADRAARDEDYRAADLETVLNETVPPWGYRQNPAGAGRMVGDGAGQPEARSGRTDTVCTVIG
jgi:hypothetical protein